MNSQQKAILKKIKGELRHGDFIELSKRIDFTREYIGSCLNPKNDNYNSLIVEAAMQLVQERNEKEKEQLAQLTELSR